MLVMGGLNQLGPSGGSSPTFSALTVTGTFSAANNNFNVNGGTGLILMAGACQSSVGSGSNAIQLNTAGARLKLSSGGTTDYLSSDGSATITAAGTFLTSGNLACAAGQRLGFNGITTGFVWNGTRVICEAQTFNTQPGSGSAEATMGGAINVNTTSTGSGAGASDLITYTMPANTLISNGRGVKIKAWGTTANNANAKTVALLFGGTTLISKQLTVSVAGVWELEATVIRTGASAQLFTARAFNFGAAAPTLSATDGATIYSQHAATTCAETETAGIVIKGRATAATSANDIVQKGMTVEYI